MTKNTDEMEQEILSADNIFDFIERNSDSFRSDDLTAHMAFLLKKHNLKPADAIRNCGIDRTYGHQVISGRRIPSRDKLITLSFGIGLSADETNELLKVSRNRTLYARDERDSIILFGIQNRKSIHEVNLILNSKELAALL